MCLLFHWRQRCVFSKYTLVYILYYDQCRFFLGDENSHTYFKGHVSVTYFEKWDPSLTLVFKEIKWELLHCTNESNSMINNSNMKLSILNLYMWKGMEGFCEDVRCNFYFEGICCAENSLWIRNINKKLSWGYHSLVFWKCHIGNNCNCAYVFSASEIKLLSLKKKSVKSIFSGRSYFKISWQF